MRCLKYNAVNLRNQKEKQLRRQKQITLCSRTACFTHSKFHTNLPTNKWMNERKNEWMNVGLTQTVFWASPLSRFSKCKDSMVLKQIDTDGENWTRGTLILISHHTKTILYEPTRKLKLYNSLHKNIGKNVVPMR